MNDVIHKLFSLEGKVALVTGASGGIGRELAIGLAGAGAKVVLNGRSREQLNETRQQIEAEGGTCTVFPADLANLAACRGLIDDTARVLGRLDILVNCAGMNRRRPIVDVTEDDFETIVNVNLRSLYFLSQSAHPIMKRQGGGKIVHVASLTSSIALGSTSVYGLTKAAVAQLAKTQAVEWAKDNIQVNCLAPGFTLTPLTEKPLWGDEKKRAWMLGRIPAKRPGTPGEMVGTVIFLSAQASSYLTGQMITVDGGALAGGSWED